MREAARIPFKAMPDAIAAQGPAVVRALLAHLARSGTPDPPSLATLA